MGTFKTVKKFGSRIWNHSKSIESESKSQELSTPDESSSKPRNGRGRSTERLSQFDFGFDEKSSQQAAIIRSALASSNSSGSEQTPRAKTVTPKPQDVSQSPRENTNKLPPSRRLSFSARIQSLGRRSELDQNINQDSGPSPGETTGWAQEPRPKTRPISFLPTSAPILPQKKPRRAVSLNRASTGRLGCSVLAFPYDTTSPGTPPTVIDGQVPIWEFNHYLDAKLAKERRDSQKQPVIYGPARELVSGPLASSSVARNKSRRRCPVGIDEADEFTLDAGVHFPNLDAQQAKRRIMRDSVIDRKSCRPVGHRDSNIPQPPRDSDSASKSSPSNIRYNSFTLPTRSRSVHSNHDLSIASTLYTAILSKEASVYRDNGRPRRHKTLHSTSVVPDNLHSLVDLRDGASSDGLSEYMVPYLQKASDSSLSVSFKTAPTSPRADSPTLIASFPSIRRGNSLHGGGIAFIRTPPSSTPAGSVRSIRHKTSETSFISRTTAPYELDSPRSLTSHVTLSRQSSNGVLDTKFQSLIATEGYREPKSQSRPEPGKLSPFPPLSYTYRGKDKMNLAILRRLRDSPFSSSEPSLGLNARTGTLPVIDSNVSSGDVPRLSRPASILSSRFTELIDPSLADTYPELKAPPALGPVDSRSRTNDKRYSYLRQLLWSRTESNLSKHSSFHSIGSLPQSCTSSITNFHGNPEPRTWPGMDEERGENAVEHVQV